MTHLIIDCGSSKCEWKLAGESDNRPSVLTTGINPYVHSRDQITDVLREGFNKIEVGPDEIHFYGAGCSSESMIGKVRSCFEEIGEFDALSIEHDLLSAARALFGNSPGIACILGTGSNSCFYDGENITDNIPALGYVLGDEGGGVDLGRRFIRAIFKRQAPDHILSSFEKEFGLSLSAILERVYTGTSPNRFIASFSPFLSKHIDDEFCRNLVAEAFSDFLRTNVLPYSESRRLEAGFIGSIAFHFKDILKEVVEDLGLNMGKVLEKPMDGLIEYHRK